MNIHAGKPYIGITDFTSFEQVKQMLTVFNAHKRLGSRHILHAGIMMSYGTLHGISKKYQHVFPLNENIAGILREELASQVYYCLHYADYDDRSDSKDITRALMYAGPCVHALQLDMPWPGPEMIARGVRASGKQVEVILQVGRNSFEEVQNDPAKMIARLEQRKNVIHRVLLDKSMGEGRSMNADEFFVFIQAIKKHLPHLHITVAGGLGPNRMGLVEPLVRKFPDISIDAQGKLRPSGSILDPIEWSMATQYLIESCQIF